ncbi:MAG TPA: SDR family NAD(P)-dependent oxidoreductase, partial [Acidimicrobiales bacterium]|nr:SDR family NAD(P)-dependent oxidoreductase [Acidimicrobiales bacterium]
MAGRQPGRLSGKVAVVTGAARGQGEAEARLFVAEGARVVVTDVLATEVRAVAADLGSAAVALTHDVTDPAAWATVVESAVEHFGGIDVLVNNAGIHWIRPLVDEEPADVER